MWTVTDNEISIHWHSTLYGFCWLNRVTQWQHCNEFTIQLLNATAMQEHNYWLTSKASPELKLKTQSSLFGMALYTQGIEQNAPIKDFLWGFCKPCCQFKPMFLYSMCGSYSNMWKDIVLPTLKVKQVLSPFVFLHTW